MIAYCRRRLGLIGVVALLFAQSLISDAIGQMVVEVAVRSLA